MALPHSRTTVIRKKKLAKKGRKRKAKNRISTTKTPKELFHD